MEHPFVSVIIPALNKSKGIAEVLRALGAQTYDSSRYEVIVVDNGSADGTVAIAQRFAGVRVLRENAAGPYAARNTGLRVARGDVIALLDGLPSKEWIARGIKAILAGADIVCGRVNILPDGPWTASEMADAITSIDGYLSVTKHSAAPTANLFVRRSIFDSVGLFDQSVRSGGDILWTRKATDLGACLTYSDDVITSYQARKWSDYLAKQRRIGLAQPGIWVAESRVPIHFLKAVARLVIPPNPLKFARAASRRGVRVGHITRYVRIWGVIYAGQIIRSAANLKALTQLWTHRNG